MPFPDSHEPGLEPLEGIDLANALIARKERGDPVADTDIQALLDDMERLNMTGTDAYAALDAHRPRTATAAEPDEDAPGGLGM